MSNSSERTMPVLAQQRDGRCAETVGCLSACSGEFGESRQCAELEASCLGDICCELEHCAADKSDPCSASAGIPQFSAEAEPG
jgi:hypothetical protein